MLVWAARGWSFTAVGLAEVVTRDGTGEGVGDGAAVQDDNIASVIIGVVVAVHRVGPRSRGGGESEIRWMDGRMGCDCAAARARPVDTC